MSNFVDKATSKISKLSQEQIARILKSQNDDLKIRNTVLDSITDGLILTDKNGKIKYHNKYAVWFLPLKNASESYVGKKVSDVIIDEDIVAFIGECISKKKNAAEFMYKQKTSMFGDMELRILSTISGESFLFSVHDFTFINKVKDQFRKNESLAAMTTMAAQVAHEIKNPLASMSIYVQLLDRKLKQEGQLSKEDAQKTIKVLADEIERLNSIAVDFLFAVKPMKVKAELCDLNKIIETTIDVISPEFEHADFKLNQSLATTLPKLMLDPSLVEQSLLNLLRNAMQSFSNNTEKGVINIHSFVDGDVVKVAVTDNGCGMSEEQIGKIFEPYYTTKANGTGLGLTTIFKITKELGGEILVSSEIGKGSTFTLVFPIPASERFKLEN